MVLHDNNPVVLYSARWAKWVLNNQQLCHKMHSVHLKRDNINIFIIFNICRVFTLVLFIEVDDYYKAEQ